MTEEEFRTGEGLQPWHGINEAFNDVRLFHTTFDHPAATSPTLQTIDRVEARAEWIDEEVKELRDAETLYDQADAYLDIAYFAIGGLVELGIMPGGLWRIVQAANMAKLQPDGSVKRREDGKILKPEGWVAPEPLLFAEIERQIQNSGKLEDTFQGFNTDVDVVKNPPHIAKVDGEEVREATGHDKAQFHSGDLSDMVDRIKSTTNANAVSVRNGPIGDCEGMDC